LAAGLEISSLAATGIPGAADSGSVRGGTEMRAATVLDDGTVFLLSLAQLAPTDANIVADYYRRQADGTVTAVDLPASGFASGHCFWGGTDATGTTLYVFRQFPDPTQFELRSGPPGATTPLGILNLVQAADFAAGGGSAVYERDVAGFHNLFLHDLVAQTETGFATSASGDSRDPAISADGTAIVFSTTLALVPDDLNGVADIYRYEPASGTFALVSPRLDGAADADAVTPDIAANGQVVCFVSADASFVPGDTNGKNDVFVSAGGFVRRCSVATDGSQADADSGSPRLSADGRFVVFVSRATNLVTGVDNGFSQVFLYDREGDTVEALSLDATDAAADADCFVPAISASGRYVTFVSRATNLAAGVDGTWYQVYRADRGPDFANHAPVASSISLAAAAGETFHFALAATDADQEPVEFVLAELPAQGTLTDANGTALLLGQAYGTATFPWHFAPAVGGLFADHFTFQASDGKALSGLATARIRMVDPDLGAVTRLSVASDGTQASLDSYLPYPGLGMSGDGGLVAFSSTAGELDPADDDNGIADIFVRDTVVDSTRLLTAEIAASRKSYRCALSGDRRSVVYYTEDGSALIQQSLVDGGRATIATVSSYLANSGPGVSADGGLVVYEKDGKVWLYVGETGTTEEVSVNSQGVTADASCGDCALSADGRVVAFSSTATNLGSSNPGSARRVYLRLLDAAQTVLVSATEEGLPVEPALKPALSATGRYVAFLADDNVTGDGIGTLYVKDVASGALRQIVANAANPALSADGRFACYTSPGTNGRNQLYRVDLASDVGSPQLVSNATGLEGDGDSYRGVLSANGRLVAFASNATNLVVGDTNAVCDIFLADFGIPPNRLPVPSPADLSTDEDVPLVDIPLVCLDAEGNDVRIEIVSGPSHAAQFVLNGLRPGQGTVSFTYVPSANYYGEDSFTYRCGDAEGWSAAVTVTIAVQSINTLPQWLPLPVLWRLEPGQEFRLDLSRFVDDPDLQEPVPDILRFSLLEGSPAAWLDGSVLVLTAEAVSGTDPVALRIGVADSAEGPVVQFADVLGIHTRPPVVIPLAAGWNLVSFPMVPEPAEPSLLLTAPEDAGGAPLYRAPVFSWDAVARRYLAAEALEPGQGYWIYCSESASVYLEVAWVAPVDALFPLVRGWQLVGPVGYGEEAVPTWDGSGVPLPRESIWLWDGENYANPAQNTIPCGQGSWIYSPLPQALDVELVPAR
jgi:Tol biopolymer transport system component